MELKKVFHENQWIEALSVDNSKTARGNSILINGLFKLTKKDKIQFLCFLCGSEVIETYKYKSRFFLHDAICWKCSRNATWKSKCDPEDEDRIRPYHHQKPTRGFLGKTHSKETREKISERMIGNQHALGSRRTIEQKLKISSATKQAMKTLETKRKLSENLIGNQRALGHKMTERGKENMIRKVRVKYIERIRKNRLNGNQMVPFWSPRACEIFEQFDKEHNTEGKYATNGGEFYIKELGYWVDYINHDLKLIMEYDEKFHQNEKRATKDLKRQKEIMSQYPDYEFKRIKENEIR